MADLVRDKAVLVVSENDGLNLYVILVPDDTAELILRQARDLAEYYCQDIGLFGVFEARTLSEVEAIVREQNQNFGGPFTEDGADELVEDDSVADDAAKEGRR